MSQTVRRAITILEQCSEHPSTAQELAELLGTHRTTALRLIQTLEESGFLRKTDGGRYGVGFRLAGLGSRAVEQFDLRALVRPHLQGLSDDVGYTVQFAIPEGERLIYVDKIEPPASIVLNTTIGGEVVTHTAGVSKAILAFLPEGRRERILARASFRRYTDHTVTSATDLREVLRQVRARGWAADDGEYETVSNCIAAPVFGAQGEVLGAVSVTAFTYHATVEQLRDHLPRLVRATHEISQELGAPTRDAGPESAAG